MASNVYNFVIKVAKLLTLQGLLLKALKLIEPFEPVWD